jgi:glycosyltransferase involved in cell wall biosynthesis
MKLKKIKVLFLHPYIPHYRDHIFCDLSKKYDITVGHSGELKKNKPYKQISLPINKIGSVKFQQKKHGKFNWQGNLKIFNEYDVVVSEMNLRFIDRYFYIISPFRKFAWVCWGIGITSPFKKESLINSLKDFFRIKIFGKADSLIFYSNYPLIYYKKYNIDPNKLFIANNTIKINNKKYCSRTKDIFLFVGTLYKDKGLTETINYYREYLINSKIKNKLIIIGKGPEKDFLIKRVDDLSLSEYVVFVKETLNENILKKYYDRAIFSISLRQSGLSVLSSFGHGVPFVTIKDSDTGGERFNIKDNYNGLLLNRSSDLVNIFKKSDTEINFFLNMGKNSYETYQNDASYENMVSNIDLGIKFSLKKKKLI